ncbi:hypothetical protein NDU88_006897 [Pleurodeles waltl]|uniref:Uncharacterized protein n=1 Tax=Pleurodeles waltl TaxID=8319 RepID=A0AAV7MLB9_PLEWA|nr:hypothetical protein NDU88_006897 [Pleurodeles waltl]
MPRVLSSLSAVRGPREGAAAHAGIMKAVGQAVFTRVEILSRAIIAFPTWKLVSRGSRAVGLSAASIHTFHTCSVAVASLCPVTEEAAQRAVCALPLRSVNRKCASSVRLLKSE